MEENNYEDIPADDLQTKRSGLVFRHKDEAGEAKAEYLRLTDVAHFGDDELNGMNKQYAPTDIHSTETFTIGGTGERIIRINGFKDKIAQDALNLPSTNEDVILRETNGNVKQTQYVKLSSIWAPTDTLRSRTDFSINQRSIEDKIVQGKLTRQLRGFDDITLHRATTGELSLAFDASFLLRKDYADGINLKYVDAMSVIDYADSNIGVGLSSIEKNKSQNGLNNYSFFGFGTAPTKTKFSNLSNGLSDDIVTRVIDEDDFRHVEYTKLSVEYPFGDADVKERNNVGSIVGPSLQVKDANGN